jgi:hypothetical protein
MNSINVNVTLYGPLARIKGKRHVVNFDIELEPGTHKGDLLALLGISLEERSYLFINSVLCDVPGLDSGCGEVLQDGDHIGIFSINHMWPYQYRDGIPMSENLKKALQNRGVMHHSYTVPAEKD